MVVIIISTTTIIIVIEQLSSLNILTIIPLVFSAITVIWTLFYQSPSGLIKNLFSFSKEKIPKMGNEMTLFLAAGVFGEALLNLNLNEVIDKVLQSSGITHVLLLVPILILLLTFLSLLGIHPVITMSVVGIPLSTSPFFLEDHVLISMGVLVGWSITVMLSPFSAVNLTLSNLTRDNSLFLGFKSNWGYTIFYGILLYGLICIIYFII